MACRTSLFLNIQPVCSSVTKNSCWTFTGLRFKAQRSWSHPNPNHRGFWLWTDWGTRSLTSKCTEANSLATTKHSQSRGRLCYGDGEDSSGAQAWPQLPCPVESTQNNNTPPPRSKRSTKTDSRCLTGAGGSSLHLAIRTLSLSPCSSLTKEMGLDGCWGAIKWVWGALSFKKRKRKKKKLQNPWDIFSYTITEFQNGPLLP